MCLLTVGLFKLFNWAATGIFEFAGFHSHTLQAFACRLGPAEAGAEPAFKKGPKAGKVNLLVL